MYMSTNIGQSVYKYKVIWAVNWAVDICGMDCSWKAWL